MPGGRPPILDKPCLTREDGTVVTISEHLLDGIRLGLERKDACDRAGVTRAILHRWTLDGARLRAMQAQGKLPRPTAKEKRLIEFVDAAERAEVEAEASRLEIIRGVAQGGGVITKTTVKTEVHYPKDGGDPIERVVERTVRTETMAPQWTAAAWFLERRLPHKYRRRYEFTGADGEPLIPPDEAARQLADSLRVYIEDRDRTFMEGAAAGADAARQVGHSGTESVEVGHDA